MSQIKLEPIAQLSPIDPIAMGLELLKIQPAPAEPFGNHLQRAKTHNDDMSSRDVADRASTDRISRDRAADDRASEDRESTDRASRDRAQESSSESPSAAESDSRDTTDVESAAEKPATEEQSDTDSGEQADSVEADATSTEEAETQGDGESDEVDVAIGAEQIKADLPTETAVEVSEQSGNESESAKIMTDGAEGTGPNAKEATVAEEQAGDTLIATAAASKETGSGKGALEDGADGKNQQTSVGDDSAVATGLDQSGTEANSPTDRPQQEVASGEGLAEESAVQTDTTARQQQTDSQEGGTGVSTNPTQQTQAETQGDRDDHSRRQEKKPTKNASTQNRIADPAPQQQEKTDDPATVSVDLKTATVESTDPVAGPQVDTADGSVKPVGNTADNQSSGLIRTDSGRPGRATAAARAPADAPGPEGSDQARFVGRVARAFEAMGDRNGPIRLKLSPAELGSLRIEISVRNGTMTAQIEAETSTARNLLLDNLPALRDRLAQQGIKIEQFDVDLSDRSPGGLPDQRPDHADSDDRREGRPTARANREETDREEGGRQAGPITRPGEGSQLNVVV